jgi:hypothetical protein
MNDLSRNHQSGSINGVGSVAFSSKIVAPTVHSDSQERDGDLSRLLKETGITAEQFLKLREAGYTLKSGA